MADVTVSARSTHRTLTAGTVDRITLDQAYGAVEILNRSTTAGDTLSVLVDRGPSGAAATDPTVLGDGVYVITAGASRIIVDDTQTVPGMPATKIRITSATAVPYSVTGI